MSESQSCKYDANNIFAKILKGELEAERVWENEHNTVIKDRYPNAPIHNLVLPKGEYLDLRHFLSNATDKEKLSFLDAIEDQLNSFKGGAKVIFNIEKDGGQVIFHLHAHVLGGFSK